MALTRNLLAGLSVAGLMLPEAVAYAGIAGLAPGRAVLAACAGGLAYALIGRSRFAILAPTSSSAAILAAALASLPGNSATHAVMATLLVGMVAALFGLIAVFRLGGLASFVSRPVLRGFAFGLAVTIIIRQLPTLTGVHVPAGNVGAVLASLLSHMSALRPASLLLGMATLIALLSLRRFPHIPGTLVVLLLTILLSLAIDLPGAGVALVGPIALDFGLLHLPSFPFALWAQLVQLAVPLTLILFAESWGTMRSLALRHGDTLEPDRELGALAAANLASALVQGMPVGAGFSAGSASEAAGAQSRLTGLVAAGSLGVLVLFANPLVAHIPEPVLAAIVIAALTHALAPAPIIRLFRLHRDQWIALAAAVAVIALGVLNGMLVAVALSIGALLHRFSRPTVSELGQIGDGHDFVDRARHGDAHTVPALAVYRPNAPLFFANAEMSLGVIMAGALRHADAKAIVLSLEESNDLDSTAIEALAEFARTLALKDRRLVLARAHDHVRDVLERAGLHELAVGATFSVADAVAKIRKGNA